MDFGRVHTIDDFDVGIVIEHASTIHHHLAVRHAAGDVDVDDISSFFYDDALIDQRSYGRIIVDAAVIKSPMKQQVAASDVAIQFFGDEGRNRCIQIGDPLNIFSCIGRTILAGFDRTDHTVRTAG